VSGAEVRRAVLTCCDRAKALYHRYRYRWHRALALSLYLCLAIGCTAPAQTPGFITVVMPTAPNNLDPRFGTDGYSASAQQLLFNDLLTLDDRLRLAPGLAASWETADYRTYVIHLRQGVHFHDGHELTSKDVVYTFNSILDPAMGSLYRGGYRDLESVSAMDPYTVRFVLKKPSGSFLINLVMKIVPAGAGRELSQHPVGTGPYEFVQFAPDDRLELKRFAGYYDGPARNPGLQLRIVPDDIMEGLELRKGGADLMVNDLAPDIVYQLQKEGLHVITGPGLDYQYVAFNFLDPVLRDLRVRRAIGYAIDRQSIVEYLRRGLATPAIGMIPPISWAFEPNVFTFDYDPDEAKRLLDEAGYRDPDGDGPQPRLSLTLKTSTAEFNRLQSAVIQQNLKAVGINLEVRTYEFATMYADILKGNFQMYTLQWVGGAVADPDILRRVFHSQMTPPAGFNRGHFSDPEVDRLIDEAGQATSLDDRRLAYAKVQQRIADLAPYISLWTKTNYAVTRANVRGVRLSPTVDFSFLKNVERQ
jgi:peptide/nickel transport system substrate-binding protein